MKHETMPAPLSTHEKISDAVRFIQSRTSIKPQIGVVLGSGLGAFAESIKQSVLLPFHEIPHFPTPSVDGHGGQLVVGYLESSRGDHKVPVAVLQGRAHYYEGHSMETVVFAVRVLAAFGIKTVVMTNAAGGINPSFREGDIMVVTDHINLMGHNPLRGPNIKELGPRFPDMTYTYDPDGADIIRRAAQKLGIEVREGIYAAVNGPCYETPAEVRMLRLLGGDAVGMSTVPEVIAARHAGMRVVTLSCITNLAAGLTRHKLNHEEVVANAQKTVTKIFHLLKEAVPQL